LSDSDKQTTANFKPLPATHDTPYLVSNAGLYRLITRLDL